MSFVNIPFPDNLAYGTQVSVTWQTTVVRSIGGFESANQEWQDDLIVADAAFAVHTTAEYKALRDHFHAVRGRAHTFPFKNYLDFEVTTAEGVLMDAALAVPAGNGTFQLRKRYNSGGSAYYKRINLPTNPIVVWRTRGGTPSIISPTINYATGEVTISGHVGGDTYAWEGEFSVQCRYGTDKLSGAIQDREAIAEGGYFVSVDNVPIAEVRVL